MHREFATYTYRFCHFMKGNGKLWLLLCLLVMNGCYDIHENPEGYYEDGTLYLWNGGAGTGNMKNGLKEGEWVIRDAARNVTGKGSFEANLMQGKWEFYFPEGQVQSIGIFQNDLPNGEFQYWRKDGTKESRGVMENGKRQGPWVFWYANENQMSAGEYTAGNRTGKWQFWYPDGNLQETRIYKNGKNYLTESWLPDGSPGITNGNGAYAYYVNGIIREKGQYLDSLATGEWEFFDETGKLIGKKNFMEGLEVNP